MTAPLALSEQNLISCCKVSHDTVSDCLTKVFEMFKFIGNTPLPIGNLMNTVQAFDERKRKCVDTIQNISRMMRRVKVYYDKIEEETRNMPPLSIQDQQFRDDFEMMESKKMEKDRLIQQIRKKNEELKKIIDLERKFIWEVNSMMNARKNL